MRLQNPLFHHVLSVCLNVLLFVQIMIIHLYPKTYKMLSLSWFTVVTLHEDLNFPKMCKACDKTINDVEEMRKHLSDSIIHADNIEKEGYFSMTNPCGYCKKEFAT